MKNNNNENEEQNQNKKDKRIDGQSSEKKYDLTIQKMLDEEFEEKITKMVDEAEKIARNYEISLKKALKKGEELEECPYNEVIAIYEKARKMLLERGWKEEAGIYSRQIEIYHEKLAKDKKLRELEQQKKLKEKEMEEYYKSTQKIESKKKKKPAVEHLEKADEEKVFQEKITEMVNDAEKIVRNYEINLKKALKEGTLEDLKCPYEDVIEIFQKARALLLERNWTDQASIYKRQIKIYQDQLKKDKKLREIEKSKKLEESKSYHPVETKISKKEKHPIKDVQKEEEKLFQEEITKLVDRAEQLARNFETKFKKALKKGHFLEGNPYDEIIGIYKIIRNKLYEKGWTQQAEIYERQVAIYQEKLEKQEKLKEIEREKTEKQKEIDQMHKIQHTQKDSEIEELPKKQIKEHIEEEIFEKKIDQMVDKAEKMARQYEIDLRKALKEGKILEENPYGEVIEIYENLKKMLEDKGWQEEASVYKSQIRYYQEKLEKDRLLKEIESRKGEKSATDNLQNIGQQSIDLDDKKLKSMERKLQKNYEDEKFQNWISEKVSETDKLDREYEKALKEGRFDVDSPYPKIIEIYRKIRRKLLDKGWLAQSEIFLKQIQIYKKKKNKAEKLSKIEAEKAKRQQMIEEMHRMREEEIEEEIDEEELKLEKQKQEKLDKAMNLISNAEETVKNYEASLEERVMGTNSPYEAVIEDYKTAKNLMLEAGWEPQGEKLNETIQFYRKRRDIDQEIRELEKSVYKDPQRIPEYLRVKKYDSLEERRRKLERIKVWYDKESKIIDNVFQEVNKAEEMVNNYKKRLESKNILDLDHPYEQVIDIYRNSVETFLQEGWTEEARKFKDSIEFYQQKLKEDEKLRKNFREKLKKEEEDLQKQEQLIKESLLKEREKLRLKEQERKREEEWNQYFESKKSGAFNLIDKAKLELQNANFDKAINFYNKAGDVFKEIEWEEGLTIINGAINSIKAKKERYYEELRIKQYKEEVIERKKQEAFEIIDKAKTELAEMNFEEAIAFYKQSRKIFEEIDWFEGISMVEDAIHMIHRKIEDIQKEKEREEYEIKFLKTKKENAFELIDKAKEKLSKNEFQEAISLYNQSKDIFKEIEWNEGISMVEDSIELINRKKEKLARVKKQEEYQKNVIQAKKEKAFRLMGQAKNVLKQNKFEKAIEIYNQGKILFEDIEWKEGIHLIEDSIHAIQKQKEQFYKEKEEQRYQKEVLETKKDKAITLIDKARESLLSGNFDEAIEIYNESKEIFKEIDWLEGIKMVDDSITLIHGKKEKIQREKELAEQKEKERRELEKLLEDEITKLEKRRKEEKLQREEEMLKLEKQRRRERDISQEAYKLLEKGTLLGDKRKFEEAKEKYNEARTLFEKINWNREVFRINNELIPQLEREKENFEKSKQAEKKRKDEREELQNLLKRAEKEKRALEKQKKLQKRKRLMEIRKSEQPLEKTLDEEEYAEILLEKGKFNEATLKLVDKLHRIESIDSEEGKRIQRKITMIKEQSKIPIITSLFYQKKEYDSFKKAYQALDNCKKSLTENNYMKAISELIEAKFNIKQLEENEEILSEIDEIVQNCRIELGQKQKVKKDREGSLRERQIEDQEEEGTEDLKSRIVARRAQRRKRIEERLKEDNNE